MPRDSPEEEAAVERGAVRARAGLPSPPPSPFHPPSPGTGIIPRGRQPKREQDWWAPDELDPEIRRRYSGGDAEESGADGEREERMRATQVEGEAGQQGDVRGEGGTSASGSGTGSSGDDERNSAIESVIESAIESVIGGGDGAGGSSGGGSGEDTWWSLAELDQNIVRETTMGRGGDGSAHAAASGGDFAEWGDADHSASRFHAPAMGTKTGAESKFET